MRPRFGKTLFISFSILTLGLAACSGGSGGGTQVVSFQLDSDADGIPDYVETRIGSRAQDPDSPYPSGQLDADTFDGPGTDDIPDGLERHLLNEGARPPISALTDTDNDGLPDYLEITHGFDPFDGADPMPNGGLDTVDGTGPGGDGISDALENFLYSGTPITRDTDSDGDGLFDFTEVYTGSKPLDRASPLLIRDLDGDGVPDYFEVLLGSSPTSIDDPVPSGGGDSIDSFGPAGDGISDAVEQALLSLGTMAPVFTTTDTDGDGLPDALEVLIGRSPFNSSDPYVSGHMDQPQGNGPAADGIPDGLEQYLVAGGATSPITVDTDSDGDGIPDHVEVWLGNDPFDETDVAALALRDLDEDGSPDYFELQMGSLIHDADDPVANGGDDTNDTTGPGTDVISDALELGLIVAGSIMPVTTATDSDGDGIPDYLEVRIASDLLDSGSPFEDGDLDQDDTTGTSGDGITDALEQMLISLGAQAPVDATTDSDGDGITDLLEIWIGSNPVFGGDPVVGQQQDVDGDGAADYWEFTSGTDPYNVDDPVLSGGADTVSGTGPAGDGITDALEAIYFAETGEILTADTDTDNDGLPDYLEIQLGSSPFAFSDPIPDGNDINDTTGPPNDGITDALEMYLVLTGIPGPISATSDFDSDGVPDYLEAYTGSTASNVNSPVPDGGLDQTDSTGPAGDAISDALEAALIYAGAIAPVSQSTDSDNDGAPDYLEVFVASHVLDADDPITDGAGDSDLDNITDAIEIVLARLGGEEDLTHESDLDDDGVPDVYEIISGADPTNADDPMTSGGSRNDTNDTSGPSGDVISDALETLLLSQGATGPVSTASDSDFDGLPDYFEVYDGSSPFDGDSPFVDGDADSDDTSGPSGDLIPDALEQWLLANGATGSIDESTDTDQDGVPDFVEVNNGTDPFDITDTPSVGTAPVVTPSILGTPTVGENLTGTYTYSDSENDPERGTSFRWLRDGAGIAGATSSSFTLTTADEGRSISFEVTPRSATGIPRVGTPSATQIGPIAPASGDAPTASNLGISGTPNLGTQLTGSYTYGDDDSDVEGVTEFRWLRNTTPIGGETTNQYTVTRDDFGASLTFEVIPVAQTGTPKRGQAATHSISVNGPPVFALRTDFTFTGGDETTVLDAAMTLTDSSAGDLTAATITFSSNYQRGEDALEFVNMPSISGAFDEETGVLTLTGTDTMANYQIALRSVVYRNTAGFSPALLERDMAWAVTESATENTLGEGATKIMFGLGPFPTGLDGLSSDVLVWLDSSEQSSIFDAEIGGNSAGLRSFSGDVHRWEDRSGNGNHATTRSGAAGEMRFLADGLNGLPVVRIDGVAGERLRFDAPFTTGNSAGTIFALHRVYGGPVNRSLCDTTNGAFLGFFDTKLAAFTDDFVGPPRNLVNDPSDVRHRHNWFLFRLDASTDPLDRLCVDGFPLGTGGSGGTMFSTFSLADGGSTPAEPSDCEFAEILVFDDKLNEVESRYVETYLASKWTDGSGVESDLTQRIPIFPGGSTHRDDLAMIGRVGADRVNAHQGGGMVITNPAFGGFLTEDDDYVCTGHNGGTGLSTDDLSDAVQRANRVWQVQFTDATSDGGNLTLHFDRNAFGAAGLTISPIQSYVLLFTPSEGGSFETIDIGVASGSMVSFHNVPVTLGTLESGFYTIGISD